MRTLSVAFLSGALGLLLLKLILAWISPLLGMLFGVVALAVKVALFVAIAYFVYALVRGKKRERQEVA